MLDTAEVVEGEEFTFKCVAEDSDPTTDYEYSESICCHNKNNYFQAY